MQRTGVAGAGGRVGAAREDLREAASFELREDAEAFAAMKRELRSGAAYEVRESPEWTQMRADVADFRTLRRGVEVAAELAERDL
mgnify:CR=1 FL=1